MEEERLYDTTFKRKSIRKFGPAPLEKGTMDKLDSQIASLRPLIPGIRTETRFLKDDEVKGMFKVDAPHYIAIYSEEKEGFAANAGFMLQQLDLYFSANGIGCCWLGASKPTKKAEPVAGLEYVIMLAFGKSAEQLQRGSVTEFKRRALSEISDVKGSDELMEPVRLAPSGMNNQSWYYRGNGERIDSYYAKSMIYDQMNQVNAGIGLYHLWLSAIHLKKGIDFVIDNPGEDHTPKGYRYVISAKIGK
jgi:hypothetical protein